MAAERRLLSDFSSLFGDSVVSGSDRGSHFLPSLSSSLSVCLSYSLSVECFAVLECLEDPLAELCCRHQQAHLLKQVSTY